MMMTSCTAKNQGLTSGSVELVYVNQDAQIYGVDIYGRAPLLRSDEYGKFGVGSIVGYDPAPMSRPAATSIT